MFDDKDLVESMTGEYVRKLEEEAVDESPVDVPEESDAPAEAPAPRLSKAERREARYDQAPYKPADEREDAVEEDAEDA